LWAATYILMGLRYEQVLIQKLLQGVMTMKELVTYQAILQEGEAKGKAEGLALGEIEEAKKILVLLARNRFGEPPAQALAAIAAVSDVKKLEDLSVRLLGRPAGRICSASTAHAVAAGRNRPDAAAWRRVGE
jgi:predicted transposase YdaD